MQTTDIVAAVIILSIFTGLMVLGAKIGRERTLFMIQNLFSKKTPLPDHTEWDCKVIHKTAKTEEEYYGEVISGSVRDHLEKCPYTDIYRVFGKDAGM